MSTITKERIELFIKSPLENGLARGEQMELARIALASLEAEPVAYIFKHPAGKLFWALTDESNKEQPDVIPVYAESPAPVVPDEIDVNDVPRAVTYFKTHRDCYADGWNACRAAMLHGAEPVNQTYKSPHTQFEQVADLYEMQFDDGHTCAFHTDAQKAAQWLQACDGNRVHEYVKLERLQNALAGNSPVTPDGWISCSERMPEDTKMLLAFSQGEIVAAYWNWVVNPIDYKKYRAFTYLSGNILDDVTHWMPLPEPPL